jgi:hypothetical protein
MEIVLWVIVISLVLGLVAVISEQLGLSNDLDELKKTIDNLERKTNVLDNEHLSISAIHSERIDKLGDRLAQLSSELGLMKLDMSDNIKRQEIRILAILDELDRVKAQGRDHLRLIHGLDKDIANLRREIPKSRPSLEILNQYAKLDQKMVGIADVLHAHILEANRITPKPRKKPIKKVITKKPKK